jgi:Iap family predicted aminopeptidase
MHLSRTGLAALAAATIAVPMSLALDANRANKDVETLVGFGPRVVGSVNMQRANDYVVQEFRKAGYQTEIQTFDVPRWEDKGSSLTVDRNRIEGRALFGSGSGKLEGRLVAVPNFGRVTDYTGLDVKGAIVLVRRGETRFLEKARNAIAAGASGVVIVNQVPGVLAGTLGEEVSVPVLGVSSADGNPLIERAGKETVNAQLEVNVVREIAKGRNVIARMEGSTQPKLIIGGHFDSVPGSPGANDNASGTAVTLELARELANTPFSKQIWFIAFDAEEDGLVGSRAFVVQAKPEFLRGLRAMLNFDMVGVNEKLGVGGNAPVVRAVQAVKSDIDTFQDFSGSDHASFASAGVPVAFFFRGLEPNYHQPGDVRVDPKLLDETLQVGLGTIKRLLETTTN